MGFTQRVYEMGDVSPRERIVDLFDCVGGHFVSMRKVIHPVTSFIRGQDIHFWYRLMQEKILTKNWSRYDGMHVVFQPNHLSTRELQHEWLGVWKKAYSFRAALTKPSRLWGWGVSRVGLRKWKGYNTKYLADLETKEVPAYVDSPK